MIVEKSAFKIVEDRSDTALGPERGGQGWGGFQGGWRGGGWKRGVTYGVLHGSKQGQHGGAYDIPQGKKVVPEPLGDLESTAKEGLYLYIQTSNCQQILLGRIFKNLPSG